MKTRMKLHLIIYTLLSILLVSCENEIPYKPEYQAPQLFMNALLNAESDENYVVLHLGEGFKIINLNEATLTLYVNNKVAETPHPSKGTQLATESIRSKKFRLTTVMHPGDNIRLEATAENGKYHVSAEVTVPQPLEKIQVETQIALIRQWGSMRQYHQHKIHLKDHANVKNYYRLDLESYYWLRADYTIPALNEDGTPLTDESGTPLFNYIDTIMHYTSHELINREDVILTDGHVSASDEDEDNSMFPIVNNKYNIFTDSKFSNSSATLKVYTPLSIDFLDGYRNVHSRLLFINIRLLTLSEEEHNYLRALNYLDDDEYDTTLMEPISLPSNVKGGLGFVGISAETRATLQFEEE